MAATAVAPPALLGDSSHGSWKSLPATLTLAHTPELDRLPVVVAVDVRRLDPHSSLWPRAVEHNVVSARLEARGWRQWGQWAGIQLVPSRRSGVSTPRAFIGQQARHARLRHLHILATAKSRTVVSVERAFTSEPLSHTVRRPNQPSVSHWNRTDCRHCRPRSSDDWSSTPSPGKTVPKPPCDKRPETQRAATLQSAWRRSVRRGCGLQKRALCRPPATRVARAL